MALMDLGAVNGGLINILVTTTETADKENWHDGDVAIGFRRWIDSNVT